MIRIGYGYFGGVNDNQIYPAVLQVGVVGSFPKVDVGTLEARDIPYTTPYHRKRGRVEFKIIYPQIKILQILQRPRQKPSRIPLPPPPIMRNHNL